MVSLVRCSVCYFLTLPLKSSIWRNVLRSNSPLGHEIQALARPENTFVCCWSHTSRLCDADGWNPERPQLDYKQYGRAGVQLVSGYVGSTPGIFRNTLLLRYFNIGVLIGISGAHSRRSQQNRRGCNHHT